MDARKAGSQARAGHESAGQHLLERIDTACDPTASFSEQLRTSLDAALGFFTDSPAAAHLLLLEPYRVASHEPWHSALAQALGSRMRAAAEGDPAVAECPQFAVEHLIHGSAAIAARAIESDGFEALPDLSPQLAEVILLHYAPSERPEGLR